MGNYISNLIEYVGIAETFPQEITTFKQFVIQEVINIPQGKPYIEQIIKMMAEVVIKNARIIKNDAIIKKPIISLEGQRLTKWKIIVEGDVRYKMEYVADEPRKSVYATYFNIPFSTYIVLGEDYMPGSSMITSGYIEDIFVKQIDKQSIFKSINLLVTIE